MYYTRLEISVGKPVAPCVIYKCLLLWRSFEVERTSVFDRMIQTIASAMEVDILIHVSVQSLSYLILSSVHDFLSMLE